MDEQFNEQHYGFTPPPPPAGPSGGNGLAIASLILGILAILFCCCLFYLSVPLGIGGLVTGIIAIWKQYPGKGMAIAGIITSAVALLLAIILFLFVFFVSIYGDSNLLAPNVNRFEMFLD